MAVAKRSKANAYARKYYRENEQYRKEKIRDRAKEYAQDKKGEAKKSREYYWANPEYRRYKINYQRRYRQEHKHKNK
jgi:hypothetical protein